MYYARLLTPPTYWALFAYPKEYNVTTKSEWVFNHVSDPNPCNLNRNYLSRGYFMMCYVVMTSAFGWSSIKLHACSLGSYVLIKILELLS